MMMYLNHWRLLVVSLSPKPDTSVNTHLCTLSCMLGQRGDGLLLKKQSICFWKRFRNHHQSTLHYNHMVLQYALKLLYLKETEEIKVALPWEHYRSQSGSSFQHAVLSTDSPSFHLLYCLLFLHDIILSNILDLCLRCSRTNHNSRRRPIEFSGNIYII